MTTEEIKQYYADLLLLQYVGQPKAYATIKTLVTPIIMNQLPDSVMNGYDITSAVGVQLDVLGKYLNANRNGTGLDGLSFRLTDSEFSQLLIMAAALSTSNASLASIQQILFTYFPNQIFVFDTKTMRLSYMIPVGAIPSNLLLAMIEQGFLPKPLGVALTAIVRPTRIPFFAFSFDGASLPTYECGFNLDTSVDTTTYTLLDTDTLDPNLL